jgi:hypothetical protein
MATPIYQQPGADPVRVGADLDLQTRREWRDWLPETLRDYTELHDEADPRFEKVMACQVALTNPDVFDTWPLFVTVTAAFNDRLPSFRHLDVPEVAEVAKTCKCLRAMAPHDFSETLHRFVGVLCAESGLLYLPWMPLRLWEVEGLAGLYDGNAELGKRVAHAWDSGALQVVEDSQTEDTDPLAVQCRMLIAIRNYLAG